MPKNSDSHISLTLPKPDNLNEYKIVFCVVKPKNLDLDLTTTLMKPFLLLIFSFSLTFGLFGQVQPITLSQLEERVASDTLYVVNFWATWCAPCVAELPNFEKLNQEFAPKKVKVLLLSIDFEQQRSKVEKFASSKALSSEVRLFTEKNTDFWINKIDPGWGGSIPATVLYKNGKKLAFHEGDFSYNSLKKFIKTHIQ